MLVWEYYWDGEPLSLEETGALLNISYERVRQIENGALEKLRQCDKIHDLKDLVGSFNRDDEEGDEES